MQNPSLQNKITKYMFTERKRNKSLKQLPTLTQTQSQIHPQTQSLLFQKQKSNLPTINQQIIQKKLPIPATITTTSSTKQLTNIIYKFTHQYHKQQYKYSQQLVRNAVHVLRTFSQIQNNFQILFHQLHEVLRRFVFVIQDKQIQQLLVQYRVRTGYSFRKTCLMLQSQLQNVMKNKNNKLQQLQNQLQTLKQVHITKIQQWQNQQKSLHQKIQYYKKLSNIQYTKQLQQKLQSLTLTSKQQSLQLNRINKLNQQYLREIDQKDNTISDQQYQIAKLKSELYDVKNKLDKTGEYFNQMRSRFDELLIKMLGIKEIIAKVQEQNNMLVSQRMKMVNRAAVAFEQLTPRPKYTQLYHNNTIKTNSISTREIFSMLVSNQSEQHKKSVIQLFKQRRQNIKLQQAQAIRNKVVDDIINSKKQMDKLQGANKLDK